MFNLTLNRMTEALIDAGCPQTDDGVVNALLERGWEPDTIAKWYELARDDADKRMRLEMRRDLQEMAQATETELAQLREENAILREENRRLQAIVTFEGLAA